MFPCTEVSCNATLAEESFDFDIPGPENRSEGTFAETTLLQNRRLFPLEFHAKRMNSSSVQARMVIFEIRALGFLKRDFLNNALVVS